RATGALLPPRLLAAAADFTARQLPPRTLPSAGQICDDHLMHQRFVELATESRLGDFDGTAAGCCQVQIHTHYSSNVRTAHAFTAGRPHTPPPAAPGTAPRINSRLRSVSTLTTTRFCSVTRRLPM